MAAQISFGKILTPLGVGMLTYGFGSFFNLIPGGDISSLLLIYGFVISLLGFALAYAQLKPVPCSTTREAYELRDAQATDIQRQARPPPLAAPLAAAPPPVFLCQLSETMLPLWRLTGIPVSTAVSHPPPLFYTRTPGGGGGGGGTAWAAPAW